MSRPPRQVQVRAILVQLHRYVGLFIAVFVIIASLTGSLLVYNHELDEALNPQLFHAEPPSEGAPLLDPVTLHEKLVAQLPDRKITWMALEVEPHHATIGWVEDGKEGADDEFYLNPYTGEIQGSRRWADITQGPTNLMPFIFRFHYTLGLGSVGRLLLGIVALLWTIDCFVGAFLTLPAAKTQKKPGSESGALTDRLWSWSKRWRVSWMIKGGALFRSLFTFHRASGLWLWAALFVFAWSAVGFNLWPVYKPVMSSALKFENVRATLPKLEEPRETPALSWAEALDHARQGILQQDAELEVLRETYLSYYPTSGTYRYDVQSSLDINKTHVGTRLWIDGDTGEVVAFDAPNLAPGNLATHWLFALHMAGVWGEPYRIFVFLLGIVITALAITGIYIWQRKLKARRRIAQTGPTAKIDRAEPPEA